MLDKLKAKYLKTNLTALKKQYLAAKERYYNEVNSDPIMSDKEFDALEDKIKALDPKWKELKKTGVKVKNKKTEVPLLAYMPSLAKAYPEKIASWLAKQEDPYMVAMAKLDGSSIQAAYSFGKPARMITRGDGVNGGDISFLLPYVNLPKTIPYKKQVILRIEAVMTQKKFKKWSSEFDNARNMVSGLLNRREPHPALADIDFVVLGVIGYTLEEGLTHADKWGFKTVDRKIQLTPKLDAAYLLAEMKKASPCAIDGIVLMGSNQKLIYENADRPRFAIAYKENESVEDAVTATVKDIIWQTSASKRIIPKVKLVPLKVGDVTVTHATLHNAQWMIDRKIGPGAKVKIVRSGDVIPKIIGVVKAAAIKYPDVAYEKKGVHFVAVANSEESRVNQLLKFFKKLDIEFIKSGTIQQLYEAGYKTPFDYLNLVAHGSADLLVQAGLGKVISKKLFDEMKRVLASPVELKALMLASNCFDSGMGERKLQAIDDALGNRWLHALLVKNFMEAKSLNLETNIKKYDVWVSDLHDVPLWSDKTVKLFLTGVIDFVPWLRKALKFITVAEPVKAKTKKIVQGPLSGKLVAFTGYRSPEQEAAIERAGGTVVPFSLKIHILLYKEGGKTSGKISKAHAAHIQVLTFNKLGL